MKSLLTSLLVILALGCSVYGQSKKEQKMIDLVVEKNKKQFQIVKNKFAFTFDCDTSNLDLTVLETAYDRSNSAILESKKSLRYLIPAMKIEAMSVGIKGCDKRATYVLTSAGWVLNDDSE